MITNYNDKQQIRRNAKDVRDLQNGQRPVFKRIERPANQTQNEPNDMKIFMVLSHKWNSTSEFFTVGVYNCIEMQISNIDTSGTDNRWERVAGNKLIDLNNKMTGFVTSSNNAYDLPVWDSVTAYQSTDVVERKITYTTVDGRDVIESKVYISLQANTNAAPESNADVWENITTEVLNIHEHVGSKYVGDTQSDRAPQIGRYDIIHSWQSLDSTGIQRYSGLSYGPTTRLFKITERGGSAENYLRGDMLYSVSNHPTAVPTPRTATNGEIGFDQRIETMGIITRPDIDAVVHCSWMMGMWILTQADLY